MILHPDVFAKAQAEIDRVVGFDRLPDFQDRSSLPYVESVVKEVYRYGFLSPNAALASSHICVSLCESWHCPVPLGPSCPSMTQLRCSSNRAGVPHRSMKDDQYRRYDIPADTMIIPNIWSVDITISTALSSHIICNRAMTRDEQIYPEAELFNPDRFMDQNGTEADQPDPKDFIFGFGRRQVALTCLSVSSP